MQAVKTHEKKRIGFLSGQINVPENFDQIGSNEIDKLFSTDELNLPKKLEDGWSDNYS